MEQRSSSPSLASSSATAKAPPQAQAAAATRVEQTSSSPQLQSMIRKTPYIFLLAVLLALTWYVPQYTPLLHSLSFSSSSMTESMPLDNAPRSLTIGCFNVRYDPHSSLSPSRRLISAFKVKEARAESAAPPTQQWGEVNWSSRRYKVADTTLFHDWDIFSFQEVLPSQLRDLVELLDARPRPLPPGVPELPASDHWTYDWAGVPRRDGVSKGEAVPLFWKRGLFDRVPSTQGGVGDDGVTHFWLSPTPNVPGSKGWDANAERMCTQVALRQKGTSQVVHIFNTHYDHLGAEAQAKSSELLLQRAREATAWTRKMLGDDAEEPLVILLGDLNSPRSKPGWKKLVGTRYDNHNHDDAQEPGTDVLQATPQSFTFLDTALSVPTRFGKAYATAAEGSSDALLSEPYGPSTTFSGFSPSRRTPDEDRIDFIMLGDNGAVSTSPDAASGKNKWRIRTYGTIPNWSEGDAGFLVSDHRAIMTRLQRG